MKDSSKKTSRQAIRENALKSAQKKASHAKGNQPYYSGNVPQKSAKAPQKLGDVLSDLMAQRGYAQIATHEALQQGWKNVVGKMYQFTRVTEVKRGILHVLVTNSVIMQELTFRKQELTKAVADELPDYKIKEIRYRIGSIR